jgi:L-lysine 6-transaminase
MKPLTSGSFRHSPEQVHQTLDKYMLADGYPLVLDMEASRGHYLVDAKSGEKYLDLFSFFGSQAVGYNHPAINNPDFIQKIGRMALCKPVNSDIYTQAMADFVETFASIVPESHRSRLFFVEGGALAVENALKAAFDWKYRKNEEKKRPANENLEVIHFKHAFHGRSGYTMSLTNTFDPRKYQYFPKFDWPRIDTPDCRFPLDAAALNDVKALEDKTCAAIEALLEDREAAIAAVIIEPIQAEGGDKHFRAEFLQRLKDVCLKNDVLLIFDEVQSGMGLTGHWWAFESLGVTPDIFAFGKKSQICGIAAGPRLDEVKSVFQVSSRINSTWGGNLVDMVRSDQSIQIILQENLLNQVKDVGAYALQCLKDLGDQTKAFDNVRGRGLMIAFDMPSEEVRNQVQNRMFENKALILACGNRSLRLRPVLDFTRAGVDKMIALLKKSLV